MNEMMNYFRASRVRVINQKKILQSKSFTKNLQNVVLGIVRYE
jgi:hypothetical protein